MEISSLRPVYFTNFRDHSRHEKQPEDTPKVEPRARPVIEDAPAGADIDFSSISLKELRSEAQAGFDSGLLNDSAFFTLLEGLPDQAIDPSGKVIDLSHVGEDSPFDFRNFYDNQFAVAQSLGDPASAQVLASIVAFMDRRQGRR